MSAPLRGQVYRADIGFGAKPWLVVSNNHRSRALSDLLAVRITTTDRRVNLPTWVPLGISDPLVGYINTDDLQQLHRDELRDLLGSLSPTTLRAVNDALRIVLALP
jgi:mRNA interferase MazF